MAITLTDAAASKMMSFLKPKDSNSIRVLIRTTGCSGMAYHLEFVDSVNDDDTTFENKGVKIVVDEKSLIYINGSEIDYLKEGLNEGFKFTNPNMSAECGCGESFTV